MKKPLSIFICICLSIFAASAQNIDQVAAKKVAAMDKVLTLTAEQESAMLTAYKINVKNNIENKKLKDSPEFQLATKANYSAFQKSLKKTLTPEQLATWKSHLTEMNKSKQNATKKK